MDDEAIRPPENGRRTNGQFDKGHKFSRGSATARRMHELRATLLEAIGPAEIRAAARTMAMLAAEGDVQAAKLIFEYSCGKPVATVELSGPDGAPLSMAWGEIEGVILESLGDRPEARAMLAMRLRALVTDARAAGPGGAVHDAT